MDRYAGRSLLSNALGIVLALVSGLAQAQQLVDLGEATASGINSSGHVALDIGIYANGVITPLPRLLGSTLPTTPRAINDSGEVVGDFEGANGSCAAFLYSNGNLIDLGVPFGDPGIDCASANAINSSGHVAGWSGVGISLDVVSFVYANGVFTEIGTFPDNHASPPITSHANGINDSGVVVGTTWNDTGTLASDNAYIYDNGSWTNLGPGIAYAINASGEVTGKSQALPDEEFGPLGPAHAFIFSNGSMKDLGTLNGHTTSSGYAINASGQVVGSSETSGASARRAFFYNGVMSDLNSFIPSNDPLKPFVTLTDARGINDDRLIAVNGVDSRTMETHAYLLQGPWTDITPASLAFESEQIGTVSASQSVTVTNAGSSSVSIDGIDIIGDFTQTTGCSTSLAPGANCNIMVAFAPTAGGDSEGTLTIRSDGYPLVVQLTGVAPITAIISANPTSIVAGTPTTLHWNASPGATCTATGGASGDGWEGSLPSSGSQSVTETSAGTFQFGLSCESGSQTVQADTLVTVTWPVVTAALSASPTSIFEGESVTLTWSSTNASTCTASGGSVHDDWPGTKATSGSQSVVEPSALGFSSISLVFEITCTSNVSGLTAQASSTVEVKRTPPVPRGGGGGGGGGAFDAALFAVLGCLLLLAGSDGQQLPTAVDNTQP